MHLPPKLQLRPRSDARAAKMTKQSFADSCVPKLELGNEELWGTGPLVTARADNRPSTFSPDSNNLSAFRYG